MFRVLTHRRRSRLTSPRFIAGSVAAHLVVALLVVSVSRATPAPVATDPGDVIYIPVDDPPPPPSDPTTPPPRPMREGDTRQLPAPTTVPDRIPDADPAEVPVDPSEYSGLGVVGDTVVANPRPAPPSQPPGVGPPAPLPNFNTGVIDAAYADTRPELANSHEAGRLLQRYYPVVYADAGVAGQTLVEIIIETNGRVRPGSARIVDTSHPEFGEAALRLIERFRFRPAKVGDQPVAVSAQIPIQWRADR